MKSLSLVFVLCFSTIAFSQVIDENYATHLDDAQRAEDSSSSSSEVRDTTKQRDFDRLVAKLESLKGVDSNNDLFVLGVTNGRQMRVYAIAGAEKTAEKIQGFSQRYRWRVYGRANDQLAARRIMTSAQREYVASKRPKFG